MNLIKLSWRNLWAKPLTSLLSLMLLTLGVGIISLLLVFNHQFEQTFERNLKGIDMVVGAKGSPLQLILSSVYHIDNPTGNIALSEANKLIRNPLVKKAIPLAYGDSYRGFRIVGTDTSYANHYEATLLSGRYWQETMEVTAGSRVARELNLAIGDTFYSSHGLGVDGEAHGHTPFRVVGIFEPSGTVLDQLLLTEVSSLWAVHEHEEEGEDSTHEADHEITALLLSFRGPMGMVMLPRVINQQTSMQAALPAYEINRLFNLMGLGLSTLRAIALVIILISGISVFISLFNSLKERKYELALMRSMGASQVKLLVMILLEGMVLSIMGFFLGLLTSHLGLGLLGNLLVSSFHYEINPWHFLPEEAALGGITLLIGLAAAALPALQAFRMDIHRTLANA